MKALPLQVKKKTWPRLRFLKSRTNFRVKVTRSKVMVSVKGLITRNAHVKYESPTSLGKEAMSQVKVFEKVKVTRSKVMVWHQRSYHKECTCEIRKPYLFG